MTEHHTYEGNPEAGFKERLYIAVARYFAPNQDNAALRFDIVRLYQEFPNFMEPSGFTAKIFTATSCLYSRLDYNRYKQPEMITLKNTTNPTTNN